MSLDMLDAASGSRHAWTSADSGTARKSTIVLILAAGALTMNGTAGAGEPREADAVVLPSDGTGARIGVEVAEHGAVTAAGESNRAALGELRRRSGLTWDQVAEVFGVSRRSIHLWASGKPMNSGNEERLHAVLSAVKLVDRGAAGETRAALHTTIDGRPALRLLAEGRIEEVVRALGRLSAQQTPAPGPWGTATETSPPLPPDVLASATTDRVHRDVGRGRSVSVVRVGRRGDQ